jgi:hypothetical protein
MVTLLVQNLFPASVKSPVLAGIATASLTHLLVAELYLRK